MKEKFNTNFYFVRHGETEINAKNDLHDGRDIPLNENGKKQAYHIRPIIEKLPIQTVCVSPLKRAQETAQIITQSLKCSFVTINELSECPGDVWKKMVSLEACHTVESFMQRVLIGINHALSLPGPILVVAHGGVHWAMCHQLEVKEHEKKIGNCIPVHFCYEEVWKAHPL